MNRSRSQIGTVQALLAAIVAAMSVPATAVLVGLALLASSACDTTCHASGYPTLGVAAGCAGASGLLTGILAATNRGRYLSLALVSTVCLWGLVAIAAIAAL